MYKRQTLRYVTAPDDNQLEGIKKFLMEEFDAQDVYKRQDESISNNHMAISTGIANQPNGESYIVFDEDTRRHLEEEGVDYMYFIFPVEKLTDIPGQFRTLIEEKGNKHVSVSYTHLDVYKRQVLDYKKFIKYNISSHKENFKY